MPSYLRITEQDKRDGNITENTKYKRDKVLFPKLLLRKGQFTLDSNPNKSFSLGALYHFIVNNEALFGEDRLAQRVSILYAH